MARWWGVPASRPVTFWPLSQPMNTKRCAPPGNHLARCYSWRIDLSGLANLEDVDIPVARGTPRLPFGVALALLAASAADASANRLDKAACADLNTELSGLLVPGLKEDMEKGPAWSAANLSPERLASINRVIELQGVLEFRCGNPARNIVKAPA